MFSSVRRRPRQTGQRKPGNSLRIKSTLLACLVMLSVSSAALAQHPFVAMNYSPFHKPGEQPGVMVSDHQIVKDLKVIASAGFTVIKTYGDDKKSNLYNVVPLIAENNINLKVYQGVYEGPKYNSGAGASTKYLDHAVFLANEYPNIIDAVIVGNECLPGDSNPTITPVQLAADIAYVRGKLNKGSNVLVATDFSYQGATNYGLTLQSDVDFIMVNIYPFYAGPGEAGIAISQAVSNLESAYQMFVSTFSKQVMIGETGWPSQGPDYGKSEPSVANEETYTEDLINNISSLGSTFLFQAYDAPWLSTQNPWGPYWGLWTTARAPKFPIPSP
jgi:exo-beta-1,3-glucanase (GH17 family)